MESFVPPGFRFHPTEIELVGYYLTKKVASQKIDLDVIKDIDLYRIEPWDLQERCRIGYDERNEWYFFSHKDKKYPSGTRTNRATMAGFWKATGRDKAVYDRSKLIGMRKTLVFYKGRAPNGQKSDWIMHEYRLESEENAPPQEEGWVVCTAFKKKTPSQAKGNESSWGLSYLYEEPSCLISANDVDYYTRQPQSPFLVQSLMCKKEMHYSEHLNNFTSPNEFAQLPQLESPSMPSLKRDMSSVSLLSGNNEDDEDGLRENFRRKKVTDWRDLDKFVASQLSHDHEGSLYENHQSDYNSDIGSLLLNCEREEDNFFS